MTPFSPALYPEFNLHEGLDVAHLRAELILYYIRHCDHDFTEDGCSFFAAYSGAHFRLAFTEEGEAQASLYSGEKWLPLPVADEFVAAYHYLTGETLLRSNTAHLQSLHLVYSQMVVDPGEGIPIAG